MTVRNSGTYDNLLLLKDAGAVIASGAATVAGQARVLDVGAARFNGRAVVDTSVLDTADTNETYRVAIQGSNVANMGSGVVELASLAVTGAGRVEIPFANQLGDTIYRYIRAFITVGGTTPSINSTIAVFKRAG